MANLLDVELVNDVVRVVFAKRPWSTPRLLDLVRLLAGSHLLELWDQTGMACVCLVCVCQGCEI